MLSLSLRTRCYTAAVGRGRLGVGFLQVVWQVGLPADCQHGDATHDGAPIRGRFAPPTRRWFRPGPAANQLSRSPFLAGAYLVDCGA